MRVGPARTEYGPFSPTAEEPHELPVAGWAYGWCPRWNLLNPIKPKTCLHWRTLCSDGFLPGQESSIRHVTQNELLPMFRAVIVAWRIHYNTTMPHSALGYQTPASWLSTRTACSVALERDDLNRKLSNNVSLKTGKGQGHMQEVLLGRIWRVFEGDIYRKISSGR